MKITLIDPGFMRTFDNVIDWEIDCKLNCLKFSIKDLKGEKTCVTNLKYIVEI
jgi:hypothetical protein